MSLKSLSHYEKMDLKSQVMQSQYYDKSLSPWLHELSDDELKQLAGDVAMAKQGGGMMVDGRYSFGETVRSVRPNGVLIASEDGRHLRYSAVNKTEFNRAGGLHLISEKNLMAEVVSEGEVLVQTVVGDRSVVARYKEDGHTAELKGVAVDYGYATGVIVSAPSLFMPATRRTSALDCVRVSSNGEARYQFNGGGRDKIIPKGQELEIVEGEYGRAVSVESRIANGNLFMSITDKSRYKKGDQRVEVGPTIVVPLQARLEVRTDQVRLWNDHDAVKESIDKLAKGMQKLVPREG
jgi:hypothetical protein